MDEIYEQLQLDNEVPPVVRRLEQQIADLQSQLARFDEDSKVACERCQKIKICVLVSGRDWKVVKIRPLTKQERGR